MKNSQILDTARKVVISHLENKTIHVLAKKTGISRSYLHHFGKGTIINPGITQVESIIRQLPQSDIDLLIKNLTGESNA